MKKDLLICPFVLALFWPAVGLAHALAPAHYPLGPIPILVVREWFPFFLMIPVTMALEGLVLGLWLRQVTIWGNLWRAAVLYVIARVSETAVFYALPFFGRAFGWTAPGWTSSVAETYLSAALCLVVGVIPKLTMAFYLYRKQNVGGQRLLLAVATASGGGYLSALSWTHIVMQIRGY